MIIVLTGGPVLQARSTKCVQGVLQRIWNMKMPTTLILTKELSKQMKC